MTGTGPPARVPTLTEVVEVGTDPTQRGHLAELGPKAPSTALSAAPADEMAQRLMADLQLHIDRVLDARLHAALEPLLQQLIARVTEETRRELASTLRDGITRALAQEMSRHRSGSAPR